MTQYNCVEDISVSSHHLVKDRQTNLNQYCSMKRAAQQRQQRAKLDHGSGTNGGEEMKLVNWWMAMVVMVDGLES